LKPVFQFRIKVEEKQETSGLLKELKYPACIKGVYILQNIVQSYKRGQKTAVL
jgi:hypothetical protein